MSKKNLATLPAALVVLAALALPGVAGASTVPFTDVHYTPTSLTNAMRHAEKENPPPPAGSSGFDDLDAGDEVARVLDRRNRRYDWLAFCRQVGARRFTCRISGWHNLDHASGRAEVTKRSAWHYRVRIVSLRYEN